MADCVVELWPKGNLHVSVSVEEEDIDAVRLGELGQTFIPY
jgi:hypothetical protein